MPKRNAFFMFMRDRRAELESTGSVFRGGYAEVARLVGDEWEILPDDEKMKYKERARNLNYVINKNSGPGEPVQEQKNETSGRSFAFTSPPPPCRQKKVVQENLTSHPLDQPKAVNRKYVFRMFQNYDWGAKSIVVCSFNAYIEPEWDKSFYGATVLPAEIGLTAFSMFDGITHNFGRVIDPGQVYATTERGDLLAKVSDELGLPTLGQVPEFGNLQSLVNSIQKFLQQHATQVCENEFAVFACDSDYDLVTNCFKWLNAQADTPPLLVRVLSLGLWAHLAAAHCSPQFGRIDQVHILPNGKPTEMGRNLEARFATNRRPGKPFNDCFVYPADFPMTKYGVYVLEKDMDEILLWSINYKSLRELCCVYHYKKGVGISGCALNKSNRLVYNILEVITLSNHVSDHIPGGHYPELKNLKAEQNRRYSWLMEWGVTNYEREMADPLIADYKSDTVSSSTYSSSRGGDTLSELPRDDTISTSSVYCTPDAGSDVSDLGNLNLEEKDDDSASDSSQCSVIFRKRNPNLN